MVASFVVGNDYSRQQVQDQLDVPESKRGGNWDTGYTFYDGAFYLFCNIEAAGRTGHNYHNHWEGNVLVWSAKSGTRLDQPEIRRLLSGRYPVHIFHRPSDRAPFSYAGLASTVEPPEPRSPVIVRWRFGSAERIPTVYLTKTWGFASPSGPLQFSQNGRRDSALHRLRPGDLVVIVGTMGEETAPDERGKILGLMEPSDVTVSSLDYELARGPQDYDENGIYRWPFGVELVRAWRFMEPRAELRSVSNRAFNMDAALGIVPLLADEADRVLALTREPTELIQSLRATVRIEGETARRKAAPPPSTTRSGIMHLRRAPAYTYAMGIEGASEEAFKIGWAFDFKMRERQFNLPSLPALGGLRYRTKLFQLWPTAQDAFRMEQALLRKFDGKRLKSNAEVLAPMNGETLQAAWTKYLVDARRK
jgi:hypothetical protein